MAHCNCGCGCSPCKTTSSALTYEGPATNTETIPIEVQGHPIWIMHDPSDIALFDMGTGEGSGIWLNWAVCDGQSHTSTTGATITTPDLRDRFVVGAGDTYAVDDTGGSATHTLTTAEMPGHNHGVTDAGHIHTATQAAHAHTLTDAGHTHNLTDGGHTHSLTVAADGGHDHDVTIETGLFGNTVGNPDTLVYVPPGVGTANDTETTDTEATHTHAGSSVGSNTTGVTIDSATTGITMANATPTITVASNTTGLTVDQEGGGDPHENRPPYYALFYIKYIG